MAAAVEVFGRQGYRQGSLKDVASSVGLSVQGVLHHFPTKELLLMATLERHSEVRKTIQHDEGCVAAMRFHLVEGMSKPIFMRLFITLAAEATDPDHPAHMYFRDRYMRTYEFVRSGLAADIEAGRAPASLDPDEAAVKLIALSDGLQLQYLFRSDMDVLGAYDYCTAELVA